jgi:hypothetical protein
VTSVTKETPKYRGLHTRTSRVAPTQAVMELSQDDCLLRPEHFAAVARALKYDSREGLVKGLSEVELSVLAAVRARPRPPARPPARQKLPCARTHIHMQTPQHCATGGRRAPGASFAALAPDASGAVLLVRACSCVHVLLLKPLMAP